MPICIKLHNNETGAPRGLIGNSVQRRSGPATVRKSRAARSNPTRSLRKMPWEDAAARGFQARRTACFMLAYDPRAMGRGAGTLPLAQRLSSYGKPFFMQSIMGKGERPDQGGIIFEEKATHTGNPRCTCLYGGGGMELHLQVTMRICSPIRLTISLSRRSRRSTSSATR